MTEIRGNKELEENLNIMDIKIGLLVKNRLTLDVSYLMKSCVRACVRACVRSCVRAFVRACVCSRLTSLQAFCKIYHLVMAAKYAKS